MILALIIAAAISAQSRSQGGPVPAIVIPPDEQPLVQWIVDQSGAMQILGD